jgi:hypothetical protein
MMGMGRALRGLAWLCILPSLAAESNLPLSAQERLEAIKASLVDSTLKTPTTIQAMSWIDSRGQLHELSVFKNTLNVKKIQPQTFERQPNGEVKAHLAVSQAARQPVMGSKDTPVNPSDAANCRQDSGATPWRHAIHFVYQPDARLHPAIGRAITQAFKQTWLDQVPPDQSWMMVPEPRAALLSNALTPYERTLLGLESGQQAWRVVLQAKTRKIDAPDPLIWPPNSPWMQVNFSLRLIPLDQRQSAREWQAQIDLPVDVQDWSPGDLNEEHRQKIQQLIGRFKEQLDAWFKCEPFQPKILKAQGSEMIINAGHVSGVRVGDEWLIAQEGGLNRNWMQGDALSSLSLAKVTAVGAHFSKLLVVAGSADSAHVNDRAYPIEDWMNGKNALRLAKTNATHNISQARTKESAP